MLIVVNLIYQFVFLAAPVQNKDNMFSLLALAWLFLLNLMLHLFPKLAGNNENQRQKISVIHKIKMKLHQLYYYILSMTFILLSMALIVLSFRMFRV